jgi:hypothetical protein
MSSLCARALTMETPEGALSDARAAIDRVLRATFWRPSAREAGTVLSLGEARERRLVAEGQPRDRR